jgi:5-methyltetrahydrofolate--homocysteine methyltransferase
MNHLLYKPDWPETKERYRAWWARDYFGRCAIAVQAPLDQPPDDLEPPPAPKTLEEQWYDLDAISARIDAAHRSTFYGGETFPIWYPGYPGIAALPTIYGCKVDLDMRTGWWHPILTDPEGFDIGRLKLDEHSAGYVYAMDVLERAARESKGKSIPSIGAFGGCGDTLAALRGTEQLLLDCIERPDVVRDAEMVLMEQWCEFYDRCHAVIRDASDGGSACWFGAWSPRKTYAAQNDFSYNISPAMFRDIFLPAIERQTRFLDHTVYHCDGVEAFRHVEALCEIPRLHAIQILPGAGKPSPLHYMPVLKKVQAAGKGLHIWLPPEEVKPALEQLSARGLYIVTRCRTETEARALLKMAEKESFDRG